MIFSDGFLGNHVFLQAVLLGKPFVKISFYWRFFSRTQQFLFTCVF